MRHPVVYDMLMWPFERVALHRWRRRLARRAQGRVLEVGAGTGTQLRWYAPGADVTALEPNAAMAAVAARRSAQAPSSIRLVVGAAEQLPFAAASFDTVVFTFAFCSVADPRAALAEARRVLVPGGLLLMLEHVHLPWQPGRLLQTIAAPYWAAAAGGCRLDRDTIRMVRDAGFELADLREHALRWVVEFEARRRP